MTHSLDGVDNIGTIKRNLEMCKLGVPRDMHVVCMRFLCYTHGRTRTHTCMHTTCKYLALVHKYVHMYTKYTLTHARMSCDTR